MEDIRRYGSAPYRIAVVHGGPGAQGGMAEVAEKLSAHAGVIEPIQKSSSVDGEIEELYKLVTAHGTPPVILIGHSWGAWLSILTAARYPESVSKLILIASAPFEEKYAEHIHSSRMKRLTPEERVQFSSAIQMFSSCNKPVKQEIAENLSTLALKADSYELPENTGSKPAEERIDSLIFKNVWQEAFKLRENGELLKIAGKVKCPVTAIHGDYDPHPAEGVQIPLEKVIKDFRFILINKCGHYPWRERFAAKKFFGILGMELNT